MWAMLRFGMLRLRSSATRAGRITTAALLVVALSAAMQIALSGRSAADKADGVIGSADGYIDAIPQGRPYRLYILGDSLASELADGLMWAMRDAKDVRIVKQTRAATGLVRDDIHDWMRSVAKLLEEKQVNIAVVAIGGNDRQDIRIRGKRYERFSEPWRQEYIRRIDAFMKTLKSKNSAVYWVGLPVARSRQMTADYKRFNGYYQEMAARHGIKFIDVFSHFRNGSNGYTAYGEGLAGKIERLRDGDGIHFTFVGARKLAQIVAKEIRTDLQSARASARNASPSDN